MISTKHLQRAGAIASTALAVLLATAAAAGAATTTAPSSVQAAVTSLLPSATVSLSPGSFGATGTALNAPTSISSTAPTTNLDIALGQPTATRSPLADAFSYADIEWKAQLAAATAAIDEPSITGFSVTEPDGSVPTAAADFFRGRSPPIRPTRSSERRPSTA